VQRQKALAAMKLDEFAEESHKNIILPKYKFDDRLKMHREVDKPPAAVFMPLGYNKAPEDNKKHYRKFFDDELENDTDIFRKKIFTRCSVVRG
jgi:hypothetical protein